MSSGETTAGGGLSTAAGGSGEGAVTIRRHRMAAVSPDPEKPGQR